MKTRTITFPVFTFAELSPAAKDRAKQQHAAALDFSWGDDYLASLKALAERFGGKLATYEIDWGNSSHSRARFAMPELEADEIAAKLATLGTFNPETLGGNGDCVLTGFCGDEDAIDGFRKAWHAGERDLDRLMQAAFKTWLAAAHADYAGQYEDDTFAELCEANGYEFTESGEIAPKGRDA